MINLWFCADLHQPLSFSICLQMSERLLDVENEAMLKIVELEKQLMQTNKELDQLRVSLVIVETTCTLSPWSKKMRQINV